MPRSLCFSHRANSKVYTWEALYLTTYKRLYIIYLENIFTINFNQLTIVVRVK